MQHDSTTCRISLTQGKSTLVDFSDMEMLSGFAWRYSPRGYVMGYSGGGRGSRNQTYMHRVIMLPDPEQVVDHVNGDPLDNRRANLRLCTYSINNANVGLPVSNTSGFRGVSWYMRTGRWRAMISRENYQVGLGYYDNPLDAARAYDAAARELYGEFARLNFADEVAR
jgi:hypothetical protein